MEWQDIPESPLAALLKAKKLEHPTSAAFDENAWRAALDGLDEITERDGDLYVAAVWYGRETARLRASGIPLVTQGFNRRRLVRLLAAFANQQYLTLHGKARAVLKAGRRAGGSLDFERMQQIHVANVGGQELTPDDLITYLVDSMPHWLFHIWKVADDAPSNEPEEAIRFAARANHIVSIEHSLRQLWLNALWVGTTIRKEGDARIEAPRDRALAERWFIWDLRQTMLIGFEHGVNMGKLIVANGKLPPVAPVIPRTVIRVERPQGGNRKFVIGRANGLRPEQRDHVSERDMLERLYTGLFLDEPLPRAPGGQLTCRDLCAAWWVLSDLAQVSANDLGQAWMADDRAVGRFALMLERDDLAGIFTSCLGVDAPRSRYMVDWFTCDPADTGRLFAKSTWSEPLLPEPGSGRVHVLLAPLLAGSPVKRVEAWMERGGISDSRGIKGRGKPFERHVREALVGAIEANELLTDAVVAPHGLKRKGESEEIDLLVRVGNQVIVGEVKCFVAPSEPIEKYNHLVNLGRAAAQAAAKRAWAAANRDAVGEALGIDDPARAAALNFHALVVLNHGLGIGLERAGTPVVDLHYLELLMSSGSYNRGARFEQGVGAVLDDEELYASQAQLEARLDVLLRDPPPLKRYAGQLRWRRIPFETSTIIPFFIELPALTETPTPNPLRDLPPRASRRWPWTKR